MPLPKKHERKGYGNMNYYDMNTQEVLSQLDTSMNGLTGGEAESRLSPLRKKRNNRSGRKRAF